MSERPVVISVISNGSAPASIPAHSSGKSGNAIFMAGELVVYAGACMPHPARRRYRSHGGGSSNGSPFSSARRMRSYHSLALALPISLPLALAARKFSAYLSLSTGNTISVLLKAALTERPVAISAIVSAGAPVSIPAHR